MNMIFRISAIITAITGIGFGVVLGAIGVYWVCYSVNNILKQFGYINKYS